MIEPLPPSNDADSVDGDEREQRVTDREGTKEVFEKGDRDARVRVVERREGDAGIQRPRCSEGTPTGRR